MSAIDFAKLSKEERARLEKDLATADGIKLYRSAGGIGVGGKFAGQSQDLARQGGVHQDYALQLARYRHWKGTTGGDPNWQGPVNMNTGEREQVDTPDEVSARRDAFVGGTPEDKSKIMADSKLAVERSQERHYDDLVAPPKPPTPEDTPETNISIAPQAEAMDKAREFLRRTSKRKGPVS